MRLHKAIIELYSKLVNINENKIDDYLKRKNVTLRDVVVIKSDLSKVKEKYREQLKNISNLDLLLNINPNQDLSSIFELDSIQFIKELDKFLNNGNDLITMVGNRLSSDRTIVSDNLSNTSPNMKIDSTFGVKYPIEKFNDVLKAFNLLVTFIKDSFDVLTVTEKDVIFNVIITLKLRI